MEKYKKLLKKKLILMATFNGLAVVFIVLTGSMGNITSGVNENIADLIHGVQVGSFIGLQIIMFTYITKYINALRNEDKLKKLFIKEHDERTKLIKDKIGGVGFNFCLGVIAATTIMSGFLNQMVFVTLLSVLIFMSAVKGFLKIYYKNKF
jgi:hypothetical protein